ncbi:MAG: hypothetical protein BMS9Abin03_283 [Thermodesulfobacteriota bacterium]|nr:MAG: hypothetical protein BMS9Abin03_283 [Thermodesulfobacteriota bacterium]
MITKRILNKERIRRIEGGFSFIPHRFLTGGFLQTLSKEELLLYFFLILVSDRHGLSFYSYDSICNLLGLDLAEYLDARNHLIHKDLICFENNIFQVLSLPSKPVPMNVTSEDPATVRHMIMRSLQEDSHA